MPRIESFIKRSFINFHSWYWNLFTTLAHYHSTIQPVTSGSTDTTQRTASGSIQRSTWQKISPIDRTNTQNLHALYSIRKHTVHRFQLPLKAQNIYSHRSYNIYPHIIDYGLPWPLASSTCRPVIRGILIYIYSSREFKIFFHLLVFLVRESQLTRIYHTLILTTPPTSSYLLLRYS